VRQGFFHAWLGLVGELLTFGDRCFYKSWWNCENAEEFWRDWNGPVHTWLKRHVLKPTLALCDEMDLPWPKSLAG
jgi:diacylglycerol O-acyltransferase 1